MEDERDNKHSNDHEQKQQPTYKRWLSEVGPMTATSSDTEFKLDSLYFLLLAKNKITK